MVWWALEQREKRRERLRQEARAEGRAEGRGEGRAEGRAEERREWEAWNIRREQAIANNEDFNEPPPFPNQNGK